MNTKGLKRRIVRDVHYVKHLLKSRKPDILFGAGVVTEVAAIGTTIKATLKTKELSDYQLQVLEENVDNEEIRKSVYKETIKGTVKNFALPVALAAASVGCYGTSHLELKNRLGKALEALATEHAINQAMRERLMGPVTDAVDNSEEKEEKPSTKGPYSAGIPTDLEDLYLKDGIIVYDNMVDYDADRDGYTQPGEVLLSPTTMTYAKSKYSDWTCNHDWNMHQIVRVMADLSQDISLFGFINLNDIRKYFVNTRMYKLEEAENYYITYDPNRASDNQIDFRVYAKWNESEGDIDKTCLYIDVFNTRVPVPGELREAKRVAQEKNPYKEG